MYGTCTTRKMDLTRKEEGNRLKMSRKSWIKLHFFKDCGCGSVSLGERPLNCPCRLSQSHVSVSSSQVPIDKSPETVVLMDRVGLRTK